MNNVSLEDKYIVTVLTSYLREIKSNNRYLNTVDIMKIFHNLGYKSVAQVKTLKSMLAQFVKNNIFVQYADKNGIKLNPMKTYTKTIFGKKEKNNNKVTYIDLGLCDNFMLKHFKKQAIILLYAEPQAIDKKSKSYDHISFTTQERIAKTLDINQQDVSKYSKVYNKIYQYKNVYRSNTLDGAYSYVDSVKSENNGRYVIVEDIMGYNRVTKEFSKRYLVYVSVGSKLILNGDEVVTWYKYREKCGRKLSGRNYQILDNFNIRNSDSCCAPNKKNIMVLRKESYRVSNVKKTKIGNIEDYFYTNDFHHKGIKYIGKGKSLKKKKIDPKYLPHVYLKPIKKCKSKSMFKYLKKKNELANKSFNEGRTNNFKSKLNYANYIDVEMIIDENTSIHDYIRKDRNIINNRNSYLNKNIDFSPMTKFAKLPDIDSQAILDYVKSECQKITDKYNMLKYDVEYCI